MIEFNRENVLLGMPPSAIEAAVGALRESGPHDAQGRLVLEPHEVEGAARAVIGAAMAAAMKDTMERLTMAGFIPPGALPGDGDE